MKRLILAAVLACTASGLASAADPGVEKAVKTFEAVGNDATKLKAFCDMSKTMEEASADEKKADAADAKIQAFMTTLGPDFKEAWTAGDNLKDDSPDLKTLDDSLDKLQSKCTA